MTARYDFASDNTAPAAPEAIKALLSANTGFTSGYGSDVFFFSSGRRHTRCGRDWSSDVCSSDLALSAGAACSIGLDWSAANTGEKLPATRIRTEERRAGKECKSRWTPYASKK